MGLFSRKDWNVIAIMFGTPQEYQVNGNRGKGAAADTILENVKRHKRTLYWAVFDQKGAVLESDMGPSREKIPKETLKRLIHELPRLTTVRAVLTILEAGKTDKAARALEWNGYPRADKP